MHRFAIFLLLPAFAWADESPASRLWSDLRTKREALPGLHQEFDVSHTFKTGSGKTQSSKRQVVLDLSRNRWRERSVSGSGTMVRIFDGADSLFYEEDGTEFVRVKRREKDKDAPIPQPYSVANALWERATVEQRPCGYAKNDRTCALIKVPLKPYVRSSSPTNRIRMIEGVTMLLADTQNGIVVSARTVTLMENSTSQYQSDTTFSLTRATMSNAPDEQAFKLPNETMKEVKELSDWDASRIKKQLAGKPAPELSVTDLKGKPVVLSELKGKTVLLDFWTTWCPPCRADAPALDKLQAKYGNKDLAIVGISVSEDRAIVEKFLSEHPHDFPVVLTSENEMPKAYQIGVFPTYIVIDPEGKLASAAEGDKGFGELRKMLKKAGLDVD